MSTVFPVRLAWYLVAVVAGGLLLYLVAAIVGFFTSVLLALPASAVLLVALRYLRARYVDSDLYKS